MALCTQDLMYKPIGLECGHKFCADCAFTCALPYPTLPYTHRTSAISLHMHR